MQKECIYQIFCHEDQKFDCQILVKNIMRYEKENTIEIVKKALEDYFEKVKNV